ncbi:MAG: hypothetical protein ACSHYF_02830 [Verrucomicrobiaceae bacterium]
MSVLSLIFGIFLFIIGITQLPTPPATPDQVRESGATLAFLFGGLLFICGAFSFKHQMHGRIGIAFVSLAGIFITLYEIIPAIARREQLPSPLVHGPILLCSLIVAACAYRTWKGSRGARVDLSSPEQDHPGP